MGLKHYAMIARLPGVSYLPVLPVDSGDGFRFSVRREVKSGLTNGKTNYMRREKK